MKKDLHSILDELTPEELDTLPEELFQVEALDDVTYRRIQSEVMTQTGLSGTETNHTPDKVSDVTKKSWRTVAAAAACIALLAGAGAATSAYAAEQKEYKAAVEFFEENELSTEGLSRREIKAVYRDITTNSFSYSKTADVIKNTKFDTTVPGIEITPEAPTQQVTPEAGSAEDNLPTPTASVTEDSNPVKYKYETTFRIDKELGAKVIDKSYVAKYNDSKLVWRTYLNEFYITGCISDPEDETAPVLVYGENLWNPAMEVTHAWVAALDTDGNILWVNMQNNSFEDEYVHSVIADTKGTYTVFSFGILGGDNWLCVCKYDACGTLLHTEKTNTGDCRIWNVTPSETGYIVQLGDSETNEYARIVKVSKDGVITDSFSYDSADSDYYIIDLMEHNGNIYLSGYATPKADPAYGHSDTRDIFHILRTVKDPSAVSEDALTQMFRDNFTALLLVCEPGTGTPQTYYSVAGAMGDTVSVENGTLCWTVKQVTASEYVYYYKNETGHSGQYFLTCEDLVLRFLEDGSLLSQEATGNFTKLER